MDHYPIRSSSFIDVVSCPIVFPTPDSPSALFLGVPGALSVFVQQWPVPFGAHGSNSATSAPISFLGTIKSGRAGSLAKLIKQHLALRPNMPKNAQSNVYDVFSYSVPLRGGYCQLSHGFGSQA